MKAPRCLCVVGIVCVLSVLTPGFAQDTLWQGCLDSGKKAFEKGDYAEAQEHFLAALREAETFGPQDLRLAATLNNLAALYRAQAKYAEAEPLYRRALTILEESLGPEHPLVARLLDNYAALLRQTNREAEAAKFEIRSEAIRATSGRTQTSSER